VWFVRRMGSNLLESRNSGVEEWGNVLDVWN